MGGAGGGDGRGTNVFDMSMTRGAASKTVFRLLGFLLSQLPVLQRCLN